MNSSPLTVISAGDDLHAQWDAFIASRAEVRSITCSPGNASIKRSSVIAANTWSRSERAQSRVFCRWCSSPVPVFGRILCSVPFMNYGGPIAATPEAAAALTERAISLSDGLHADYLELRCAQPLKTDMPVSLRKVSMTIELDADPEKLWDGFSAHHRKNVRRAMKNELDVRVGGIELLDPFYHVLELSWRHLGTPLYAKRYFRRVLETFPDNTHVYICQHKDKPAGVALVGHFNGTVEGLWAGRDPALRDLQANYVLYWGMIRHTCHAGYRRFHLGRSTTESGAEDVQGKVERAHATALLVLPPPSKQRQAQP